MVDLTENPKCFPYLVSWSGIRPLHANEESSHPDGLTTIAQLLSRAPDMAASAALCKLIEMATISSKTSEQQSTEITVKENTQTVQPFTILDSHFNVISCGPTLVELLCHLWRAEEAHASSTTTNALLNSSGKRIKF
ncbi:unnamed protein product [Echinostoma caproni]|uniref:Uncharacterized protein n=1 Tax=Echinostoma caproni TaxID=27848 RepID=A0A3P8HVH6_9TREM|nr:unnamed protein product [Echinostoma caproni]